MDFQKAFDPVSWKFTHKTFWSLLKKWIHLFQNGSEFCVLQNGHLSEFFYLESGCRQGDPISTYLFILCAEILGIMIRQNKNIKGIFVQNKENKISQYADDTQPVLNGR